MRSSTGERAREQAGRARSDLRVVPTDGDFPHARRRAVKLACCTTTCCFTIIGGAGGLLVGSIVGIVRFLQGVEGDVRTERGPFAAMLLGTGRFITFLLWYGVVGLLIGAGIGFVVDFVHFGL